MSRALRVVYLDRDGTINVDRHYLSNVEGFAFCDGAVEGLRAMAQMGLDLVVVTNQSGIARGYLTQSALAAIHAHMAQKMAAQGVAFAGIYYCPHGPDAGCSCRKPKPGLIHRAEADLGRRAGVMIGDKPSDMAAGRAAGMHCLMIGSAQPCDPAPDAFVPDLVAAAQWIKAYNAAQAIGAMP